MAKRLFDLIFSLAVLLVAAPLILVIAALVKLDSPGPALYAPQMVGKNGALFRLLRFRTMRADESSCLSPEQRLTRVGRLIRNVSLDHLPSLFNVLKGDLSIVGPRPMEPEHVDLQELIWQRYFSVRPGLLNYAVLRLGHSFGPSKANNLSMKQRLELEYIERQSLGFDLMLLQRFAREYIISGGNVKARGQPDPALAEGASAEPPAQPESRLHSGEGK